VTTIGKGLSTMPYHHESLALNIEDANALIARVRQSASQCTSRVVRQLIADIEPAYRVIALAIREPAFPKLPDCVSVVRKSYRLQCAADGMMYQLALGNAADELGIKLHLCARGQEMARAAARLQLPVAEVELFVNVYGRPVGPPWTEEHRRAYAAGIAVLAEQHRLQLQS